MTAVTARMAKSDGNRLPMILTGQALLSLRDSGFSLPAALAEVIDNSIEARANTIKVRLDESKKHVHRIVVSDDGDGMDVEVLHRYLQIGFSTRYMRKDTIGKYGVGAKLAALNFAKKIDVWSRDAVDAEWHHVGFDLDKAITEEKWAGHSYGIEAPDTRAMGDDIVGLAPEGTGTVVVWSDVDRLDHGRVAPDFNALRVDLEQELARIFREYIDGGIGIIVNERRLLAHDPLFLMQGTWADTVLTRELAKTNPEHHQVKGLKKGSTAHFGARVIADEPIKVKGSVARVRVTFYPEEVTRKRGFGGDKLARELRVPDNEGMLSFMRMKREIAYTNVPRMFGRAVDYPDRFIGIEVAFDPDLDDFFGVRNVKRGVEPHGELRDKIRDVVKKAVQTARMELEERWGKVAREEREHLGEHAALAEAVKDADKVMPKGKTAPVPEEEVERALSDLAKDTGHESEEEEKAYRERIRDLPFVMESVDFPGKMFIDVKHLNNQVIIRINTRHRFYRELWVPLNEIAQRDAGSVSGADAVATARRAVEGLMLMVVAYGKAQSMNEDPGVYDDLTSYWGQFIDTLMGKVKNVVG